MLDLLRWNIKRRTLKTWVRCCLVLAATMILLVANKTANSLGQVAFFAAIVAVMLPPSMALSMFVFASFTLIVGMLIGWAWGSAAMAAGLRVRSQSLLMQQQQEFRTSVVQDVPVPIQQQIAVFSGKFLDPRSSTVYGVFFFIGTFALGVLRAFIPKLALMSIFGSIVMDIICSYGPLFPTSQYTLAKMFLLPTLYYIAIAIGALAIIFPESLNHVWLTTLDQGVFNPICEMLKIQSSVLSTRPSDHATWETLTSQGVAQRRELITNVQALLAQVGFVDLEISVGKLGSADLKKISDKLQKLVSRASGLLFFQGFVNERNKVDREEESVNLSREPSSSRLADRFNIVQQQLRKHESEHGHDLDSLMPILESSSTNLRSVIIDSVFSIQSWLVTCNAKRWTTFLFPSRDSKLQVDLSEKSVQLKAALAQFRKSERSQLVKPFERFFDSQTGRLLEEYVHGPKSVTARSLYVCFTFADTLVGFGETVLELLSLSIELQAKRSRTRVWFPSGFGKIWRKLTTKTEGDIGTVDPLSMGTSNDPMRFETLSSTTLLQDDQKEVQTVAEPKSHRHNPDALPPKTAFGKFAIRLGSVISFFRSHEAIFGLRHAAVSIALWIPAVCESSTWFYYDQKGIWALIMAQSGLAVYAGDQIAGFFLRIFGTLVGLVVGMAVWYIGAGNGRGNPYGIVIATTAFIAPFLLARMTSPPQYLQLWALTGVTIVFVVGYSWIDSHMSLISNSGIGYELGWKRALLVIIGFTAGFIVMLFPHPTSARILVRKILSATIEQLGSIYMEEVEGFLQRDRKADGKRVAKTNEGILAVAGRLQGLAISLTTAKFEPQVQGLWPAEQYNLLFQNQIKMLASLGLLVNALSRLDDQWCEILVYRTPLMNPNMLSDLFSTITIVSGALRSRHPLPATLPRLRDRIIYHARHLAPNRQHTRAKDIGAKSQDSSALDPVEYEQPGEGTTGVEGSPSGLDELTLDVLKDENFAIHATAIVAISSIYRLFDESTDIVRTLCGQDSFKGYDDLRHEYLAREEKLVGSQ